MKTLPLLSALACIAFSQAEALVMDEPILINFGDNVSERHEYVTAGYKGADKTWNQLSRPDSRTVSFQNFHDAAGHTIDSLRVTVNNPISGENGGIETFTGDTSVLSSYFSPSAIGRVVNYNGGSSLTFSGLKAGTYTLQVLGARGNNYGTAEATTYSITGNGVSNVTASVLTYSNTADIAAPVLSDDGSSVTATTYSTGGVNKTSNNWALMEFTFTVGDGGGFTLNATGNTGNIAAVALIPEPSAASLGILGMTALLARRRRRRDDRA